MKIPKLSAPLAKAIRTSEGILVWGTNLALALAAGIDPSGLPPKYAAIVAGAVTALHVVSRTSLKVVALQQGIGIAAPIAPSAAVETVGKEVTGTWKRVAATVVPQVVSDAEEFAHQPVAVASDSPRPATAVKPEPVA
jgi:hypothetical protein